MTTRSRHFSLYDAGAYDGETEHRIMVNFFSLTENNEIRIGQSELVKASEFAAYRKYIEQNGWSEACIVYPRQWALGR